ncbi:acetylcholine receptor subunit alpha-like [Elysia marginata]|uniref:Acetylcholine receptor subunit alpha-like n=1 Tax=Elysia marginata TaxID=1093978 RepID=A0AAV4JRV8_9GAST|nr:acetylcholine receptor subunit alpha-like [Elysia marginata]
MTQIGFDPGASTCLVVKRSARRLTEAGCVKEEGHSLSRCILILNFTSSCPPIHTREKAVIALESNKEWNDANLVWTPREYNGIDEFLVPSEEVWRPDVVLYDNADGNYEVTLMTKATLHSNGNVVWEPPAIYKSSCTINVEFFPFDEQR